MATHRDPPGYTLDGPVLGELDQLTRAHVQQLADEAAISDLIGELSETDRLRIANAAALDAMGYPQRRAD